MCVKVILNALQTIITFTVILEVLTPYMCILNCIMLRKEIKWQTN